MRRSNAPPERPPQTSRPVAHGERLESRLLFSTFTVSNTADSGTGSLRQAITSSNSTPGADVVQFNIPGSGAQTINTVTPLFVRDEIFIDGTSQPGYADYPLIEVVGLSTVNRVGFDILAPHCTISGLSVNSFIAGFQVEASDLKLTGNFIGLRADGITPLRNYIGVSILAGTGDITIGGTAAQARNVISGNLYGLSTPSGSVANLLIEGNYIGTDQTGTKAVPNDRGLALNHSGPTTLGGTAPGTRNIISGNTTDGVLWGFFDETDRVFQGNYIGLSVDGTALGNGNGVNLYGGIAHLEVGGSTPEARNVISGNTTGILISRQSGVATENLIRGNYIGTDPTGTISRANDTGISIEDGIGNVIGGTSAADRNIVSGNRRAQISVLAGVDSPNSTNLIQGNYIGPDVAGNSTPSGAPNATGVMLIAAGSTVGGAAVGAGNVISGNDAGIDVYASNTRVQGNLIGTNASGTAALRNVIGLYVIGSGITIGGTIVEARNVISGNDIGINMNSGSSTQGVVIQGNYIGTNAAGTAAVGNGYGINMTASSCTIGGANAGAGNVISGNTQVGIDIFNSTFSSATSNRIRGNNIGVAADGTTPIPNGGVGILLEGVPFTVIGGTGVGDANVIANNGGAGVAIQAFRGQAGAANSILRNSIYNNVGLGIDLGTTGVDLDDPGDPDAGPNNLQNAPQITAAGPTSATIKLTGPPNTTYAIDFYSSPVADPSGYGEGKVYLGTASVKLSSIGGFNQSVSFGTSALPGSYITATATDSIGSTSEFSNAIAVAAPSGVVGRYVFYNNSIFDHYTAGPDVEDASAIATDKSPLLPGNRATFPNYTSYTKGINGVMIDLSTLPANVTLSASDFVFQTGTDTSASPAGWGEVDTLPDVYVTRESGAANSDRVTLIWSDDTSIKNAWLRITIKAGARTGLTADDVFYFGNAVGETGDSANDAAISASDYYGTRDHLRVFGAIVPVDFRWDFNRDTVVDVSDLLATRSYGASGQSPLQLITVPPAPAAPAPAVTPGKPVSVASDRLPPKFSLRVLSPPPARKRSIVISNWIDRIESVSNVAMPLIALRRKPNRG